MKTLLCSLCILISCYYPSGFTQTNSTCLECHDDRSLTMDKAGHEISIDVVPGRFYGAAHKDVACVECHVRFDPEDIPHRPRIGTINCVSCHEENLKAHAFHSKIAIEKNGFGGGPSVACRGCHTYHYTRLVSEKYAPEKTTASCKRCHEDVASHFTQSGHGLALGKENPSAPNCLTCHKTDVVHFAAGMDSSSVKLSQEQMCLACHLDDPAVREKSPYNQAFIKAYEASVHGAALIDGNWRAANCVDCHGSHDMKGTNEPTSFVNKMHIPETCAQCHVKVAEEYQHSSHGEALLKGNHDAPACTDCHGEHNIFASQNPKSRVFVSNISNNCAACHGSLKLTEKYGVAADRLKSFEDSYHGLALKAGSMEVANCASCHGAHNIRPSSDSSSTIHKSNLQKTCGKCHPGANDRFAVGLVHLSQTAEEPAIYWVSTLYTYLILVVVGAMLLHNLIDLIRKARVRYLTSIGRLPHIQAGTRQYERMTLNERLQHGLMALSFMTLVITGFMLRYPETWWVEGIRSLSDSMFEYRSLWHRIGAVVMVAACLYHIFYTLFTQRGRRLIRDLLPARGDFVDSFRLIGYNLGISQQRPQFGRFSYIEKLEYWALVWGSLIMILSGFIMWFENSSIGLITKLGWDISRTVHFYEAWLATLSIFVWHFYFVIFNPTSYPMNTAWLTGKISEEEMQIDHGLELARRKSKDNLAVDSGKSGSPQDNA